MEVGIDIGSRPFDFMSSTYHEDEDGHDGSSSGEMDQVHGLDVDMDVDVQMEVGTSPLDGKAQDAGLLMLGEDPAKRSVDYDEKKVEQGKEVQGQGQDVNGNAEKTSGADVQNEADKTLDAILESTLPTVTPLASIDPLSTTLDTAALASDPTVTAPLFDMNSSTLEPQLPTTLPNLDLPSDTLDPSSLPPVNLESMNDEEVAALAILNNELDLPNLDLDLTLDPSQTAADFLSDPQNALILAHDLLPQPDDLTSQDAPQIRAYAKLEFPDGHFYITTHAVILGRDQKATKKLERERELQKYLGNEDTLLESAMAGRTVPWIRTAPSIVSESGGLMGLDGVHPDAAMRHRSTRSVAELNRYNTEDSVALSIAANTVASATRENSEEPDTIPFIPLHAPAPLPGEPDQANGRRSISKQHAEIMYNFDDQRWVIHWLGRNGGFVNSKHYDKDDYIPLGNGDQIQISNLEFSFCLPNSLAYGSHMSYDFEDGRDQASDVYHYVSESSAELSDGARPDSIGLDKEDLLTAADELEIDEMSEEFEDSAELDSEDERYLQSMKKNVRSEGGKVRDGGKSRKAAREEQSKPAGIKIKLKMNKEADEVDQEDNAAGPGDGVDVAAGEARRRGPGRPPKNGYMSKREQALLARQARDAAKSGKAPATLKTETSQPEGHKSPSPGVEAGLDDSSPKRKYTKRKLSETDFDKQNDETPIFKTESQDHKVEEQHEVAPPKEKKPPRPVREPSPEMRREDYTDAQMAKPTHSYVTMIYDAMMESPTKQMSLPQLYKAIERKYPYFKFTVTTNGWQSSVRHNLSQHAAFRKVEREGKGWMWGLCQDVPIEKEKKRRLTPPLNSQQPPTFYAHAPNMVPSGGFGHSGPTPHGPSPGVHHPFSMYPGPSTTKPAQTSAPATQTPMRPPMSAPRPIPVAQPAASEYRSPYDLSGPSSSTPATGESPTPSAPRPIPANIPYLAQARPGGAYAGPSPYGNSVNTTQPQPRPPQAQPAPHAPQPSLDMFASEGPKPANVDPLNWHKLCSFKAAMRSSSNPESTFTTIDKAARRLLKFEPVPTDEPDPSEKILLSVLEKLFGLNGQGPPQQQTGPRPAVNGNGNAGENTQAPPVPNGFPRPTMPASATQSQPQPQAQGQAQVGQTTAPPRPQPQPPQTAQRQSPYTPVARPAGQPVAQAQGQAQGQAQVPRPNLMPPPHVPNGQTSIANAPYLAQPMMGLLRPVLAQQNPANVNVPKPVPQVSVPVNANVNVNVKMQTPPGQQVKVQTSPAAVASPRPPHVNASPAPVKSVGPGAVSSQAGQSAANVPPAATPQAGQAASMAPNVTSPRVGQVITTPAPVQTSEQAKSTLPLQNAGPAKSTTPAPIPTVASPHDMIGEQKPVEQSTNPQNVAVDQQPANVGDTTNGQN